MIRNPHTLEDSWWDGPERFQFVNRNVISIAHNEDLFKFTKIFAPIKLGLHIGGCIKEDGRVNWAEEEEPLSILLDMELNKEVDIYAKAQDLPFKDESFGYIVSFHTLEHIKGNLKEIINGWLRVLVPNGIISLSMPNKDYFLHDEKQMDEGKAAYHEMNPMELFNLFNELNVDILLFNSRKNNFDMDIVVRKI